MAAVFSNTTKLMLKNVIRHTNSHNKNVEETEMWQQHERIKELGGLDPSNPSYGHDDRCNVRNERDRRRNDYWNSRSEKRAYLSTSYRSRRAHMDEEEEKGKGGASTSTFWMRQLEKLESSDSNRWDHSGYRELYPQDFKSDRSDSDSPRPGSRHLRKDRKTGTTTKKKKEHRSKSKKRKREKKRSSQRHRKQTRRREPQASSDQSPSSASSPSPHRKRPPPSKRQRYNKTKSDRYVLSGSSSSSSSFSDSDSGADSPGRGRPNKQNRRKRTKEVSVSRRRQRDTAKSCKYASSESSSSTCSDSDSDSDSKDRFQSQKQKRKKRTRESSVSSYSSDGSDSVSSPDRKKVKTGHSGLAKRMPTKQRSKHKRRNNGNIGHKKRVDREEQENQLVIKMWKNANGLGGSSSGDFDRRLRKEISSQYHSLKRQYPRKGHNPKSEVNGNSLVKLEKRRQYSPPSCSSD